MVFKRMYKSLVLAVSLAVIMLFVSGCAFLPKLPDVGDSETQSSLAPTEVTHRPAASARQIEEINDYLAYLYNTTNNALAKEGKYITGSLANFLNSTKNEKGLDESLFLYSAENLRETWQRMIDEHGLFGQLVTYEVFTANPSAYRVVSASDMESEREREFTSTNPPTTTEASTNPPTTETPATPPPTTEQEDCPVCYGLKACTVCYRASLVYGELGFVCGACYNSHVCATCKGSGKKDIQGSGGGGGYIQPPNNGGGGGGNYVDPSPQPCGVCNGMKLCVTCNGLGYSSFWLGDDSRPPCSACHGNKKCWSCGGTGVK